MGNLQGVISSALMIKNMNFDVTVYPVRAQGTITGVQWSSEVVTVTAATDYTLLSFSFDDYFPRLTGTLAWVYYTIYFQLKAGNGTADLKWKLQARNKAGTWTDMCAEQTAANIGTVYVDKVIKGYLAIGANINQIPFEMRIIMQSNEATPGIATGKIKNTTSIRAIGSVGGIG